MKYKIQQIIILEELENETVKDIVLKEFTEQEFLVEYLKNPRLTYWKIDDSGNKFYYKNGELFNINPVVFANKD
jgi:hypothetical protein